MSKTSDEWEAPLWVARIRNPQVGRAWLEKIRAWESANPEISHAWNEANAEENERRWQAQERRDTLERVRRSGISDRACLAYESGLERTPATEAVEAFMGSGKTFLLLMGSAGAGKTLATTTGLAAVPGLFIRALEMARLSVYERNDRATLERAHKVKLLVLDDLGAENLHDGWRPVLDELIDVRWGSQRRTIITTNLDKDAFKARYGVRIVDRIRDDGFVEKCGDQSRRGKNP